MLEVAGSVGVVYAEEFVLFILKRVLHVDDAFALFGDHLGDTGATCAVVVYDVAGLIEVRTVLEYRKAYPLPGGVAPPVG